MQPLIWGIFRLLRSTSRRSGHLSLPRVTAPGLISGTANTERLLATKAKVKIPAVQAQRKFKHAAALGVQGTYNKTRAAEFTQAVYAHVHSPSTLAIRGGYKRAHQEVLHFVDPGSGINVMTTLEGRFVSTYRLNPGQLDHLLTYGVI